MGPDESTESSQCVWLRPHVPSTCSNSRDPPQHDPRVPLLETRRFAFLLSPPSSLAPSIEHLFFLACRKKKAFERAVYTTKSFFIALALVQGKLTVEQAALASHVEVDSQIEVWGEVEDSPFPFLALSFYSECLNHSVDITFPLGICFIQLTMWTTRMSVDNLEA